MASDVGDRWDWGGSDEQRKLIGKRLVMTPLPGTTRPALQNAKPFDEAEICVTINPVQVSLADRTAAEAPPAYGFCPTCE